jgi:EmrB/QacA subfamily drug resistance transporter
VEHALDAQLEPISEHVHARRWWTLGVLCLSLVIIVLDNTVLNVALPTLVRDLGASTSQLQWIVDSYTLVFAGLLLTAGSLGDRFGRRGALTVGLVVFGAGSIASAMATSAGMLIATRAFMGIGGALIMPATLSLLTNVFRDPKERARAIAIWAGFSGVGVAIGPLTGGFLLEHFSWHSVFWLNIPIVILALIGGRLFVPTSKDPTAPKLDLIGAALSTSALITLVWAIIEAPSEGWTSSTTVTAFAIGAVLMIAFVVRELTTEHPMLDMRFFKSRRFSAANIAITLTFFAMFGSLFLLSQHLQFVMGFTPLEAGIRMAPYALGMMVAAPTSARLVERLGTKAVVTAGLLMVAGGLFSMSLIDVHTSYPSLLARMMVLAVGMGLVMAPATESVMGSLPRSKAGVGSAVNDTTRQVGGALGVAVIGSLVSSVYASELVNGLSGSGLPAPALDAASEGLGSALAVGQQVGGATGQQVSQVAMSSFVDGLSSGLRVGAVVSLVAAAIVMVFLPARAPAPSEVTEVDDDSAHELALAD